MQNGRKRDFSKTGRFSEGRLPLATVRGGRDNFCAGMCTRTFATVTYGCKVNQYESQAIEERLMSLGFARREEEEGADVIIVNTCTVTDAAFQEARKKVRQLARRNPGAPIIVTGCAADSNADEFARMEGVTVFGNRHKGAIAEWLARRVAEPRPLTISRFRGHTRAFLKVQDGCDLCCSFCIIPQVRGPSRSRPLEDAVEEARRLVDHGYREIVLTGVHLGSYGKERNRHGELPVLIRRLLEIRNLGRVRLSSIEANEITDELLDLMRDDPKRVCPHLHLPLQSGDDEVLRAMRRRYNTAQFARAVERLRERVPEAAVTTDIIVGFPTETEEHFQNTLAYCRRMEFARVHVFPYSRRQGTDAARLPDLPAGVKKGRVHRLERVAGEVAARFYSKFVGREVDVLVERDGSGYTERYLHAVVPGAAPNTLVSARVLRAEGCTLICAHAN